MRYEITMKSGAVVAIDAENVEMAMTYLDYDSTEEVFPGRRSLQHIDAAEIAAIVVIDEVP